MQSLVTGALCALLLLASPLALAEWQLDGDTSRISFVSVKRGKMAEVQRFDQLSGQIDDKGAVRIIVPLASIDSGLALRDERMRNSFFEVERFPEATITSQLDLSLYDDLQVGQSRSETIDFNLDLHGQQRRLKSEVLVSRPSEGRIEVATMEPLVLKLVDFDLEEKLEPLKEVANIPSITPEVPVFAVLGFRQVIKQNP
ncbi:YceI family protein [Pseudomonas sp. ZM23]|uniref:YceI family protein n=1 Tax=Pseudomonas triclosanedens TaxID=2961893 RepID=A0ABY6ZUZ9_9PSED|nr:YceI family protein [Pseudomonas triclosanedens]MCP8467733.1 YceI family protein [Pseudomonas triclosanedens]MCP8473642.1 YceI family protein [Pseudomonas triclosanedens]MCP8479561.1 YceI family protein [Pseudomonas triclosanedens]WAI48683.1 YceI family protein [Pseudomonas triclosanedens]